MDKYIGSQKIKEYNELDGRIQFTLENGAGDTVTVQQFESLSKEKPYDDGMIRVFKWVPAVREIMEILLKNDMRVADKQFVLGRVDETIISNYDRASAILYGVDFEHNIGLKEIHKAITSQKNISSVESVSEEKNSETPTPTPA